MAFAALEVVGFKEKMKRCNSYNPKIKKTVTRAKNIAIRQKKRKQSNKCRNIDKIKTRSKNEENM